MTEMELYQSWRKNAIDDPDLQSELSAIENDAEAIQDRFYRDLAFGTGGLRGVIGAGTNRMNIYTVRKATQGLANYVKEAFSEPSVAISYDSRIKSTDFAKAAAEVLAANGVKVHIYTELKPTPMLSFAVRALHCSAGIMVTASHNPAKYNGYKAYGSDGCQMTIDAADAVLAKINALDIFNDVKHMPFDEALAAGMISYIGDDVIEDYFRNVLAQGINTDLCAKSGLKIVYTPLNGTGNKPVRTILNRIGIQEVTVVKEQENPDGNFTTCPYPNPEIREALQLGLQYCDQVKPDLLLATDPDADRVGIAVPDGKGGYALFSGNEVGAMLLEYICEQRMPKHPVAVKTIVTTDIVEAICKAYGVELIEVLTGFKFIGEQIGFLEAKGEEDRYIFGFEESYGYLTGSYVRDKDGVSACSLAAEAAAWVRDTMGISLYEWLKQLYVKYGFYQEGLVSVVRTGKEGAELIQRMMVDYRANPPKEILGSLVVKINDIQTLESFDVRTGKKTHLEQDKSNVLQWYTEDGTRVCVRPSGTEPKIKFYFGVKATLPSVADYEKVRAELNDKIERIKKELKLV